ncbi:MAG: hypothetical protein STHCBS139747_000615 [Sporothrix thermara]
MERRPASSSSASAAVFTSYWTTLSFLLASPPYVYPSYAIGLFGLIGIVVICLGPVYGRFVIEHIVAIAAVLQAVLVDFGNQASTTPTLRCARPSAGWRPHAQNRVNAANMIASFTGHLTGTAARQPAVSHGRVAVQRWPARDWVGGLARRVGDMQGRCGQRRGG